MNNPIGKNDLQPTGFASQAPTNHLEKFNMQLAFVMADTVQHDT